MIYDLKYKIWIYMMLSLFFTQSIYKLKLNAINVKKLGGAHTSIIKEGGKI